MPSFCFPLRLSLVEDEVVDDEDADDRLFLEIESREVSSNDAVDAELVLFLCCFGLDKGEGDVEEGEESVSDDRLRISRRES